MCKARGEDREGGRSRIRLGCEAMERSLNLAMGSHRVFEAGNGVIRSAFDHSEPPLNLCL